MKDVFSLTNLLGTVYNPKQLDYILAPEFEVAWVGGIGAGKSFAMCAAAIRHIFRFKNAKFLMGRKTLDELYDNPKPLFFQMVKEKGLLKYFDRPRVWDYREKTNYCRTVHGSELLFTNLDTVDKIKNVEYTSAAVDQVEEVEFDIYQMLCNRVRASHVPPSERHVWSVANDEGDNWVRARFLAYEPPHVRSSEPYSQRKLIRGTSFENPHLDEGAKARYRSLPLDVQKKYVFATMEAESSRLIPDVPTVEPIEIPAHWPRWVGIDPARSTGVTAAVWLTANPDKDALGPIKPNAPHFYQEYWEPGRAAETHTDGILALNGPRRPRAYVMDRTAWAATINSRTHGSLSVGQLYVKAGLPASPSEGDEWARVMLFIEAIKRGLTVSSRCENLIRQMPQYRLKDTLSGRVVKGKARFHGVDAGGYALSVLPTRLVAVDIHGPQPMFRVETDDPASRRHWEGVLSNLPLRRASQVTEGLDELELHREGRDADSSAAAIPLEDEAW